MLTCKDVFDLAERFAPILRYAKGPQAESFFPVEAEAWLTHCSPEDYGVPGNHRRGTALYKYDWDPLDPNNEPWIGSVPLVSCQGPGPVENRKCSGISLDSNQPARYIGAAGLRSNGNYFLSFGGWEAPGNAQAGDMEYLRDVFGSLAGNPPETPNPPPVFCISATNAAWYAEITWPAAWASIKITDETGKEVPNPLAPARDLLAPYLMITYHMLYPAMERVVGESAAKNREAQWEAITIVFRDNVLYPVVGEVTPQDFTTQELFPLFVIYSRSYTNGGSPRQIVRPWPSYAQSGDPTVEVEGNTHPVSWVTLGTHKNMWKQLTVPVTIAEETPNPGLLIAGGSVMAVAGVAAGYCALYCAGSSPGGPYAWLSCGLCWVIVAIIALIALLLLLFAFLCKSRREKSQNLNAEDPLPVGDEVDQFNGSGPSGGAPPGTPGAPPNAVGFILRVVDRFNDIRQTSAYPPQPRTCENPVWWRFAGRWGVQITARTSGLSWDSGTRLSDKNGLSRAFWNVVELVNFTQTTDPNQRGLALEPPGEPIPNGTYSL